MRLPAGIFSTSIFIFIYILAAARIISAMEGRLFYVNFLKLDSGELNVANKIIQEIFILGTEPTKVRLVEYNSTTAFTLTNISLAGPDYVYRKQIDYELKVPVDGALAVAIYIAADRDISVIANKGGYGSTDGYLALPLTTKSTEFFLASYDTFAKSPSSFSIASATSSACVDIRYYNGATNYRMQRLTLKANEVFTSESITSDYTGVSITSTKPIAVLSGHACAQVPKALSFCDHLVEQVPPVSEWGKEFIASSFIGEPGRADRSYIIRIIAGLSNTTNCNVSEVDNNGNVKPPKSIGIEMGNFYEHQVNSLSLDNVAVVIKCNQKALVMQYGLGNYRVSNHESLNSKPDPFMVTVPPLDHYTNNQAFHTSKYVSKKVDYNFTNYITYIFSSSYGTSLFLDDTVGADKKEELTIPSSVFGTAYKVISRPIGAGVKRFVEPPDARYAVFVYGYSYQVAGDDISPTGYGYLAGYKYLAKSPGEMITDGYWFNGDNLPTTPSVNNTNGLDQFNNITLDDLPTMTALWQARFCTVKFDEFLISKQCSEGYEKYFRDVRLAYLNTQIAAACRGISTIVNMSPFQFNEYTCGIIYITSTIQDNTTNSLDKMMTCFNIIDVLVKDVNKWVIDPNDANIQSVLKPSVDYNTAACHRVHFMEKGFFTLLGKGWSCPTRV